MDPSTPAAVRDLGPAPPAGIGTCWRPGRYERWLIALFLLSLPLVNPLVHGDGVGYYAYARALLIEHRLDFAPDWLHADPEFRLQHSDAQGRLTPGDFTATGHIDNHFSIGPAILWLPFLVLAHAGVLLADAMGAHVAANGYSMPYRLAMSLATALYGFLGLWISFLLARRYVAERWAFLATLGMWAASSLPVYMYFNPAWSHAQSAFAVALFLWYGDSTRTSRSIAQWIVLGLIGGLMIDVYYVNGVVLLFPLLESLGRYRRFLLDRRPSEAASLFAANLLFLSAVFFAFTPTWITKKIVFGSSVNFGYAERWSWSSPALLKVAFSSDHGVFSWTPIAGLGVVGLFFLARRQRTLAVDSLLVLAAFLYVIGCYQDWDGLSSFGNRFFISLTPIFVVGLAALLDWLARLWKPRRALAVAAASTALLVFWNVGMMYQWGLHLIPVRGPIPWREAVYNQFAVVPGHLAQDVERYFLRRGKLMQHIENEDVRQLKARPDGAQ